MIKDNSNTAKLVYILYLTSFIFLITGIIGLIMAYINLNDAPLWLQSHYKFQIRTFWLGMLYLFTGVFILGNATFAFVWITILALFFWFTIRCIKGLKYIDTKQAHPTPTSWFF